MKSAAFCYIPVLHKGYFDFLKNISESTQALFLIGESILTEFPECDYIKRKDSIRAIDSLTMKKLIVALKFFENIIVLTPDNIQLFIEKDEYFTPDEDISKKVGLKYLSKKKINFIPIFLRWNQENVQTFKIVSANTMHQFWMNLAIEESRKSWDWWRQVGAALIKNGKPIIISRNQHIPHEQKPYIFGDPRSIFKKGVNIELSTAEHAEASLIGEAAKNGIALNGTSLYVTDFPCPPCAKLIARSGIKELYFLKGYSILDGEEILKNAEVKIIKITI